VKELQMLFDNFFEELTPPQRAHMKCGGDSDGGGDGVGGDSVAHQLFSSGSFSPF